MRQIGMHRNPLRRLYRPANMAELDQRWESELARTGSTVDSTGAGAVCVLLCGIGIEDLRFSLAWPTTAPMNAPQKPAAWEAAGASPGTRSAAKETAQKPTKLSPATFIICEFLNPI